MKQLTREHWWFIWIGIVIVGVGLIATLTVFCIPKLLQNQMKTPLTDKDVHEVTITVDASRENLVHESSEENEVVILTTGDVMLGRSVNSTGWRRHNWGWWLAEVAPKLNDFDYVIANLETPIIRDCPIRDDGMLFCADASAAAVLAESPIDLVTLANNHVYNQGSDGYAQTQELLAAAGEDFVNDDELFKVALGGKTFGVIAYDDVSEPVDLDAWKTRVRAAAAQVDVLLAALHFGVEYQYQPTSRQVELAHATIDAGATLVIGNHSHWLGTVEKYGDGAIIYSHGNFVFDQEWARETKQGLAVAWHFRSGKLEHAEVFPIWITNYGLAHWASGTTEGTEIMQIFMRENKDGEMKDGRAEIAFR